MTRHLLVLPHLTDATLTSDGLGKSTCWIFAYGFSSKPCDWLPKAIIDNCISLQYQLYVGCQCHTNIATWSCLVAVPCPRIGAGVHSRTSMRIAGSDSEPENQSWSPTNKCREVLPEWQFDAGFQLFYLFGDFLYIYMYIHTHIYMYIYMVYPKCLWVKTHSVDVGFGMPQESGPNEPAERWFFLCPCWSDPPPWKPHPWRGRWKPHGIHEDISWVYNQWWC